MQYHRFSLNPNDLILESAYFITFNIIFYIRVGVVVYEFLISKYQLCDWTDKIQQDERREKNLRPKIVCFVSLEFCVILDLTAMHTQTLTKILIRYKIRYTYCENRGDTSKTEGKCENNMDIVFGAGFLFAFFHFSLVLVGQFSLQIKIHRNRLLEPRPSQPPTHR